MTKGKEAGAEDRAPLVEGLVWVCFAIAAVATVYVLMKEPEDAPPRQWDADLLRHLTRIQVAAFAAAVLAGLVGLGRILTRGGGQGLFGMAVLFNVILASFWALRFLLAP